MSHFLDAHWKEISETLRREKEEGGFVSVSDLWDWRLDVKVGRPCLANQQQIPEQVQETLRGTHPIRRLGTPEDVAQTALFLASDNSTWISGIVVDVAGGSVLL